MTLKRYTSEQLNEVQILASLIIDLSYTGLAIGHDMKSNFVIKAFAEVNDAMSQFDKQTTGWTDHVHQVPDPTGSLFTEKVVIILKMLAETSRDMADGLPGPYETECFNKAIEFLQAALEVLQIMNEKNPPPR